MEKTKIEFKDFLRNSLEILLIMHQFILAIFSDQSQNGDNCLNYQKLSKKSTIQIQQDLMKIHFSNIERNRSWIFT